MINSSKHSRESNNFAGNSAKNFDSQDINDDIEVFDLLKMTADIEKIFCEAEKVFEDNFEKLEEGGEEPYLKNTNSSQANSNNNSLLANGNIWQNYTDNGDDSLILAEKFEKLKKTRNEKKNLKFVTQKQIFKENCFSLGSHLILDDANKNFSNLMQSKFFEKEATSSFLNKQNLTPNKEEADFSNPDETSSIKNFDKNFFNFVQDKKLISSPQSISTNLSETGNTDKSRRSLMNVNLTKDMTPSPNPTSQNFINKNVFNSSQNLFTLSKKKLKFEELIEPELETDSAPQIDFYSDKSFSMINREEKNANYLINSRNFQFKINKFDYNFDDVNYEIAVPNEDEFNNNNTNSNAKYFFNKSNGSNNGNYSNTLNFVNNQYDFSNVKYINYNKYSNENVETSPNYKTNLNYNPTENYFNYNYCKYFIEETTKKMNLIKTENNNNSNIINSSNIGNMDLSSSNSNTYNNYNININNNGKTCNNNNQKIANENTPNNSKLSYKERKKDLKSNKKGNNGDDENNKIILENIIKRKDKRTTIMIKNIPNKYTLKSLVEDLNTELKGKYDLLYLPLDYVNNCNLGFAFINFVESFHIILFFELFRGKKWKRFNSEKICELAYAKIQGKNDLITHFEKGTVLNFESKEKRPMIMNTPYPLPKIVLPTNVLDTFIKYHPWSNLEVSGERFLINSFNGF